MLLASTAYQRGDTPLALAVAEHTLNADPRSAHLQAVLIGLSSGLPAEHFRRTVRELATHAREHLTALAARTDT